MKARDILILAGLVGLILVLTVAEEYAERRRESRREKEQLAELQRWQQDISAAFGNRWANLSADLRATLDSMASEIVAGGISEDSLAVVVVESGQDVPKVENPLAGDAAPAENVAADSAGVVDSLAHQVTQAYEAALAALPADLTAYEKRVATNEVVSLIRVRFGLTSVRFDSLLMRAGTLP